MAPLLPLQIWPRIVVDSNDFADCRCSLSLLTRENTTSTNALQTPASAAICAATACAIQNFAASRRWACRCCRWRCTLEGFQAVCLQLPAQKMQSGWPQGRFSSMGHHHHHPTLLWCIACACLFPGCFPMAGSRRPSVGVSIALRIFSAGRRWWVCICSLCGGATGKADALHRAVRVLKQPLQKHCLPAWPPMVLSYLECHTGNHGLASNRQFEVLCRMQRFARREAPMFSPLLGASAAPVHRLYQFMS